MRKQLTQLCKTNHFGGDVNDVGIDGKRRLSTTGYVGNPWCAHLSRLYAQPTNCVATESTNQHQRSGLWLDFWPRQPAVIFKHCPYRRRNPAQRTWRWRWQTAGDPDLPLNAADTAVLLGGDVPQPFHNQKKNMMYQRFFLFFLTMALALSIAQADMIVESTRIIYPEAKREVSFKVSNVNKERATLIQMWLDDGNAATPPEEAVTPFNLTPPPWQS